MTMIPRMTEKELDLLIAFLRQSDAYLEFGAGGSTCFASSHVRKSILSVDSSQEWLDAVQTACVESPVKPTLIHVDIGAVGNWGFPSNKEDAPKWPAYHESVWDHPESRADLIMVDGRFRVACFAQAALRRPGSIIGFHDFSSRPHYHGVRAIAREIARAEDLSFFLPLPEAREQAEALVARHSRDPN